MIKDNFFKLNIDDMITYLNNKLNEGQTVIRIREDLGIGEKKLQKIIKESGYKYNQKKRQYILDTDSITKVLPKGTIHNNLTETGLESNIQEESNTLVIPDNFEQQWNELIKFKNTMSDMEDDIKALIKAYKQGYYEGNTEVIEVIQPEGITIREFKDDIKATTIKLHSESLDSWNKFCEKNKQYNKQDLWSMALEEYISKYDK